MKKLLAFCMAMLLVGCSAAPSSSVSSSSVMSDSRAAVSTPESSSSASESSSSSNAGIEVEQDFGTVTITVPASMYASDFDPDTYAKEMNFDSATLNDDMVTIVMSKDRHRELLKEMRQQLLIVLNKYENNTKYPYVKKITANESLTKVTLWVEKEGYESAPNFSPLIIQMPITYYQMFETQKSSIHLQILDETTEEVLHEETF